MAWYTQKDANWIYVSNNHACLCDRAVGPNTRTKLEYKLNETPDYATLGISPKEFAHKATHRFPTPRQNENDWRHRYLVNVQKIFYYNKNRGIIFNKINFSLSSTSGHTHDRQSTYQQKSPVHSASHCYPWGNTTTKEEDSHTLSSYMGRQLLKEIHANTQLIQTSNMVSETQNDQTKQTNKSIKSENNNTGSSWVSQPNQIKNTGIWKKENKNKQKNLISLNV